MAYAQKEPAPVAIPETNICGRGPNDSFSVVLRGCVDSIGITRWCFNPPEGGIKCEMHCSAGGRPILFTNR